MKTAKRIIVALLMVCLAVTGLPAEAQAADGDRAGTTLASRDVLEYYEAENMNYIDTMPALLQLQYKNEIELADYYLEKLYGDEAMLSTSDDFVLDQYCRGIKLGVFLDVDDAEIVEKIRNFTNAAALLYVRTNDIELTAGRREEVTRESATGSGSLVRPQLNAWRYDAEAAVAYAHEWTEEGQKLSNPSYHREDADCTNFASQVLYAGGIPQVRGPRKEDSSWYYEYTSLSRPSYTWGGANNLYFHLKNHSSYVSRVTETADIEVGDIISFDTDPDDGVFHIDHTAVVTKVNGTRWSDILLTYHSTDREDYPASNLINKGYEPYAWSIG